MTLRFALKILRKLIQADIVKSFKGANGGYMLNRSPAEISFGEIMSVLMVRLRSTIVLPANSTVPGLHKKRDCNFRRVFSTVNQRLREDLYQITLDQFLPCTPEINTINNFFIKLIGYFKEEYDYEVRMFCLWLCL